MFMKKTTLISILLLFSLIVLQIATASVSVGYVSVKPNGDLESGKTNVTANFTVQFTPLAGETFPSDESLLFSTDLDNPVWKYSIILDGVENARPAYSGKNLEISGWELSYKKKDDEHLNVELKGSAPKVDKSKQIDIVAVGSGSGKNKELIKNASAFVTNPGELTGEVSTVQSEHKKLLADIEKFKGTGVDTSEAESKAKEASDSISGSQGTQYANAQIMLQNAQTFVKDGYTLLDKSIAKKEIADAKEAIDSTDEWITYFKDEKKLSTDPRLAPIITKREFAVGYSTDAQSLLDANKFTDARSKAEEAYNKATEVFNDSQNLNSELDKGGTGFDFSAIIGYLVYIIAIIVILVIIFVIYRFMKKRGGGGSKKRGGGGGSFGWKNQGSSKGSSKGKKSHGYDELF